jgi:hypothetical protein
MSHPDSARPALEELESRIVLYSTAGNAWPNPGLITISFVPDGTVLGSRSDGSLVKSTLFADFNATFGSTTPWQNQILKAAQVWAQQTNINFAVVSDNGSPLGASGQDEQGDPNVGDIRIGGDHGTALPMTVLAQAYLPPPANNYSIAGDTVFNTAQNWNIGSTYDLFTVATHEVGHAIGMGHSTDSTADMYASYQGTKTALAVDDIAGIQSVYGGARQPDAYDACGSNGSFATASTASINATSKTALITGLDISTTSDADFYKFVVPSGSASSAQVQVQSAGLSLLAPSVYVYNANDQLIGYASGAGHYGTTIAAKANITAGSTYYVKVVGADTSAFGTGDYSLAINTGTGTTPKASSPKTTTAAAPAGSEQTSGGSTETGGGQHGGLLGGLLGLAGGVLNNLVDFLNNGALAEAFGTIGTGDPDSSGAASHVAPTAVFLVSAMDSSIRSAGDRSVLGDARSWAGAAVTAPMPQGAGANALGTLDAIRPPSVTDLAGAGQSDSGGIFSGSDFDGVRADGVDLTYWQQ